MAKFWVYLDKLELCPKNLSLTNSFGEYKSYRENGQLWEICSYIDGNENGEYKTYDENGELIEKCYYDNGIKVE